MFKLLPVFFLLVCTKPESSSAKLNQLTREYLTSNSKIPDKRQYLENQDISPCSNFYEHVCSKEIKSFQLPEDRSSWIFSFTDDAERLLQAKKNYFLAFEQGFEPTSKFGHTLKNFYAACMNAPQALIEEKALIKKEVERLTKIKTADDWINQTSLRIQKPGSNPFKFFTIGNLDNPEYLDLVVLGEMRTLGERSLYQKPDVVTDFKSIIQEFFKNLGMDEADKRADDVVAVEKSFADVFPTPAEERIRISLHTEKSVLEWKKQYPQLKLDPFLKPYDTKKIRVRDYASETMELMQKAFSSDSRIEAWKNALIFYVVSPLMDDAFPNYRSHLQAFRAKHLGAPPSRPPRQERCTTEIMSRFGMELDTEVLPILFPHFPKEPVVELVESVRASILAGLEKNTWLSTQARSEAKQKIQTARLFLVKPEIKKDWNYNLAANYDSKHVHANRNLWEIKKAEKELHELGHVRNRNQWEMGPLTLNAYYDPTDNKFVLLQGILQNPFFDPASSKIENFGGIGTVIGHELGHSIDDMGSRYDHEGKLHQWMTEKDVAAFKERSQIFVDRFNQIEHNGWLTLGENIGDHVGITFSYDAAFKNKEGIQPEDQQKFFKSYAKLWCGVQRPEFRANYLKTNPHALGSARVNEQVIHHPAFAKAFQCKKGDKMFLEPEKQARIW